MPKDTTPDPRDMQRAPEAPEFVQPKEGEREGPLAQSKPVDKLGRQEVRQRPPLPDHPAQLAADVEDEDADPVGARDDKLDDTQLNRG